MGGVGGWGLEFVDFEGFEFAAFDFSGCRGLAMGFGFAVAFAVEAALVVAVAVEVFVGFAEIAAGGGLDAVEDDPQDVGALAVELAEHPSEHAAFVAAGVDDDGDGVHVFGK